MSNQNRFGGLEVRALTLSSAEFKTLGLFIKTEKDNIIADTLDGPIAFDSNNFHQIFFRVSFKKAVELLKSQESIEDFRVSVSGCWTYCSHFLTGFAPLRCYSEEGSMVSFEEESVEYVDLFLSPTKKHLGHQRPLNIGQEVAIEHFGETSIAELVDYSNRSYTFSAKDEPGIQIFIDEDIRYRLWSKVKKVKDFNGFTMASAKEIGPNSIYLHSKFLFLGLDESGRLRGLDYSNLKIFTAPSNNTYYVLIKEND